MRDPGSGTCAQFRVHSVVMTVIARHCLLALLLILQSVGGVWAQAWDAAPIAARTTTMTHDCDAMKSMQAGLGADSYAIPDRPKSDCPCCDKHCPPAHCAAMSLLIALPAGIAPPDAFLPVAASLAEFTARAPKHFSAPPTPPPNQTLLR